MQLRLPKIDNLLMALGAAVAFGVSFRVNQLFDDFFVYAPGMSLLFLPAGVKLLFVLIGRLPAICGIMVVSVYLGYGIWPDKSIGSVIYFAFDLPPASHTKVMAVSPQILENCGYEDHTIYR